MLAVICCLIYHWLEVSLRNKIHTCSDLLPYISLAGSQLFKKQIHTGSDLLLNISLAGSPLFKK